MGRVRKMQIDIDVRCSVVGVQRSEDPNDLADDSSEEDEGALVRIGFLLKDKLKVFGVGEKAREVIMKQRCFEQKIMCMRFSEIEDEDNLEQVVERMLRNDMHMDPQSAKKATSDVTAAISDTLHPVSETYNYSCTILLKVRVDCSIEKRGSPDGEPSGEHGYARLKERLSDEDSKCSICQENFSSSKNVFITTCHHMFHPSCILQWLGGTRKSCPICRFDLASIAGGSLPF